MDAGYTDNHGVYPLAVWLNSNREWIRQNTAGVVLLQVSASRLPRDENGVSVKSVAPELLGFVTTSFNKTLFHSDRLLEQAAEFLNRNDENFFRVISFAYEGEASLSWYLSKVERLSLVYPFLSDRQVKQLVTSIAGDRPNELKSRLQQVIPFDLITTRDPDIMNSGLTEGAYRFRADDFAKAEQLRIRMGRQLSRLRTWWMARRELGRAR